MGACVGGCVAADDVGAVQELRGEPHVSAGRASRASALPEPDSRPRRSSHNYDLAERKLTPGAHQGVL